MGKLRERCPRVCSILIYHRYLNFDSYIENIGDTLIGKYLHFPGFPTRLQLGIWDASSPAGTCEWAKGPIDWSETGSMTALVKSVTVECPYS
jgi:hypothetical protein